MESEITLTDSIFHNVLPYLEWNDLLRCRRVCKRIKAIVHSHMNAHPELAPEFEINEEDKTFDEFMKMNIPTTKVFINNTSGRDFFEKAGFDAAIFLNSVGSLITSLKMDQISFFRSGKERNFLEETPNVIHFQAHRFGGYERGLNLDQATDAVILQKMLATDKTNDEVRNSYPDFFGRLKTVKIGNNYDGVEIIFWETYIADVLMAGQSLTTVSLMSEPFIHADRPLNDLLDRYLRENVSKTFHFLRLFIRKRLEDCTQYEIIDFVNWHEFDEVDLAKRGWMSSRHFLELCETCIEAGVKLRNVGSNWFQGRDFRDVNDDLKKPELGIPVLSLVNLQPCVLSLDMPNLERIEVQSSRSLLPGNWRDSRPKWTSLKSLNIAVDCNLSKITNYQPVSSGLAPCISEGITENLLRFFFTDICRVNLTELCLQFDDKNGTMELSFPSTSDLLSSCPYLKKLTLIKWPGSDDGEVTKLLEGLSGLEDLSLEDCEGLGDDAFVGTEMWSPAFFKLKKLSLKGLDKMPKISDKLLSRVISRLGLTHLILTSGAPVQSITLSGLRSLHRGRFAETIEKFPFRNWSIAEVSSEEFMKEEASFRSHDML